MRYICYYCENDILKKDNLYYCKNCNKNITENKVIKIINLNEEAKNGIFKCPNCKASDITYDYKKNLLKCNYCRSLYKDINIKNYNDKIKNLIGVTIGDATNNIDNSNDIVTIKCEGCGASVIINTKFPITRCSWCHQTLTLNKPLPSGVTPDKILPFKITKEKAFKSMKNYIKNIIIA